MTKIALQQDTTQQARQAGSKGGILYYHRDNSSPLQTINPYSLQRTILEWIHDKGGYLGVHKTLAKLRERFYWPGHKAQVEKWVKECELCLRHNSQPQKPQASLGTITAEYPFQKLSWDNMGPLPTSGSRYIYSSGDRPVHQMGGSISPPLYRIHIVGHSPVDEIVCRYRVPVVIHSDQGAKLTSSVIQHLCL